MKINCTHVVNVHNSDQPKHLSIFSYYRRILLFCLFLISGLYTLEASDVRGSITWQKTGISNEIEFTVIAKWKKTSLDKSLAIGESVSIGRYLHFGDGNLVQITNAKVINTSNSENWITVVFTANHTYVNDGNYIAFVMKKNANYESKIKCKINVGDCSKNNDLIPGLQYDGFPLPENRSMHCVKPGEVKSYSLKAKNNSKRIVARIYN